MMYARFASVYDELMSDIPYGAYISLLETAVGPIGNKKILDVACGTGILSVLLAERGADVTGIDLSEEMLDIARRRLEDRRLSAVFLHQAMQDLDAGTGFDAAIIPIDSLNYLESEHDVSRTFQGIHKALKPGGTLLFDVHSTFKTDILFPEGPFTYDSPGISYIWETEPGAEMHSVHSELAFFVKGDDGRYDRFDEVHYQRTFPIMTYAELLEKAGFSIERIFADWEEEAPEEESERVFFQVRK
ncbi:class I SAM-dependent DNA methyltransferase [Sporosarcina trichiuri]|uniref:class I SAM-dependent DNA methyltransferase n=1 Tax=Sporosarcina trichiuri TaxID=3056445 RepID=UPI0025B58D38|nr:class I SAM-dependent methyltransferase [Sporosarcina sp. 0.2-SM1T-5]WJY28525.1 class I SAM-dependent methyltransferase [Sporosarcina sp. 0.2-SM1T-5]